MVSKALDSVYNFQCQLLNMQIIKLGTNEALARVENHMFFPPSYSLMKIIPIVDSKDM